MRNDESVKRMGDDELLAALGSLAGDKRRNDAAMLVHVGEVDARRLYAREGYPSMFQYCVEVLRLSEGAAAKRVRAARLARRFPMIHALVAGGELHLAGISMLGKHLTDDNHRAVLDRARGASCRQIEALIAELAPRPDVPASVRKLPARRTSAELENCTVQQSARTASSGLFEMGSAPEERSSAGGSRAAAADGRGEMAVCPGAGVVSGSGGRGGGGRSVEVLAPERYLIKATLGTEAKAKLDRATDLLRHSVPDGDLAAILERALDALIETTEKRRLSRTARPRAARSVKAGSRTIPATRCGGRSPSAMATGARSCRRRAAGAPRPAGWSFTTSIRSGKAARRPSTTSACCAGGTTSTGPTSTTAGR